MKVKKSASLHTALFEQAQDHYKNGNLAEASAIFRKLLAIYPKNSELLAALGYIAIDEGKLEQGTKLLSRALEQQPKQPIVLVKQGMALAKLNKLNEAANCYKKAILYQADFSVAHNNLGNIWLKMEKFSDALACYQTAIALTNNFPDFHYNLGNALLHLDRLEEATDSFLTAINLNPHYFEALVGAGSTLQQLNRFEEAAACYQRALVLKPDYEEGHLNLGNVLNEMHEYQEAEISYSKVIALAPDNWQGYYLRANVYREQQRYQDAVQDFETVLKLSPNHVDNYNFLGITELKIGNPDQAITYLRKALDLQPDNLAVLNNHAYACMQLLLLDEAAASLETALAINPGYAGALFNKSLLKLLMGEFLEGWRLYEWRWHSEMQALKRNFIQPTWLGDTCLSGKTLFIYAEQGFGDFIQFSRYLSLLASQASNIILETPAPLLSVMSTLPVNVELLESGLPIPEFDLQCPLLSLPLACKTDLNSIPKQVPYLQAPETKLIALDKQLKPKQKFRIGIVWSGSVSHKNDANRSIPINLLTDLFNLHAEFHCLQKEIRPEDLEISATIPQLFLHHEQIADFGDTAALISAMDLVISVDTSVAHLAGAMAKPLWLLLPYAPDFRWLLDRNDSPWYPSAKLYRQQQYQDWSTVIDNVTANLADLLTVA